VSPSVADGLGRDFAINVLHKCRKNRKNTSDEITSGP
jgi:hypothetical protein